MGLIFDIVSRCTIYAGIMDAGQHQHLLVGLVADHAGLGRLFLVEHELYRLDNLNIET